MTMSRLVCLTVLWCAALFGQSVVVLPFFNHATQANLDWIGESISESVRDSLSSEGVLVLDRADRLEAYRRLSLRPGAELTHASILKIGESLDAQQVVYGSYELLPSEAGKPSKGVLRISARILDLKRTRQSSPFNESGALEDLAALQAHLGWQALGALGRKNNPSEQEFLKARPAVRLDAVESYIRGLLATAPEQRHRLFTQAARLDEKYSQPCFQLGKIYWERNDYTVAATWLERVARSDPHFYEAQFFLGLCRYHTGDFASAEKSFELVSAAMPLNEVFNDLGATQDRRGNAAAAIATYQKAIEGDDRDPDYHFNLGYVLWRSAKFPEAVASLREALARNPGDMEATTLLGRALKREGPRPGDLKVDARQRLKTNYDETAFRQLQAALQK